MSNLAHLKELIIVAQERLQDGHLREAMVYLNEAEDAVIDLMEEDTPEEDETRTGGTSEIL